jgi:hypothetical protein
MSAETVQNLAILSAVAGLVCFMWPTLRRLFDERAAQERTATLRSPLWWAGLIFTILALLLLRLAPGAD